MITLAYWLRSSLINSLSPYEEKELPFIFFKQRQIQGYFNDHWTIDFGSEEDFKMLYLHYLLLANAGIKWDPSLEQNFNPMSDNLVEIEVVH